MNKYQSLIDKYRELSKRVHDGQKRKNGSDYFFHCETVAQNVKAYAEENFFDNWVVAGLTILGYLHDSLEDQPERYNSIIVPEFIQDKNEIVQSGGLINLILNIETGIKAISKKTKGTEKYSDYVLKVKSHEWARLVKIQDLEHNMSDLPPGNMLDKYDLTLYFLTH